MNRRTVLVRLLLTLSTAMVPAISAYGAEEPHGLGIQSNTAQASTTSANPLGLPLLQQSQVSSAFTFVGSFTMPSTFVFGGSGTFTSGSVMYTTGLDYDPQTASNYVMGIGSVTMPTITPGSGSWATPSYTGGNGAATTIVGPSRALNYVAPTSYTLSSAPITGATSITLPSAPPSGTAPGAGWYVIFTGASPAELESITSVSGNTLGFAALPAATYTTGVSVYQWQPLYPFGTASGDYITGSLSYSGNFYVSGRTTFDTTGANLGWILQSSLSTPGNWQSVNTVQGYTAAQSRQFAGSLGLVPAAWRSLLGNNPAYVANALGPSIDSENLPYGYQLTTFNPANVTTGGAAVPLSIYLNYPYVAGQEGFVNGWPTILSGRSFSGPFPLTTTTGYYPATLASAPSSGATAVTLSLPNNTVTVTGNTYSTGCGYGIWCEQILVTSTSNGPISNSGINYGVNGPGYTTPTFYPTPAWTYTPGTTIPTVGATFNGYISGTTLTVSSGLVGTISAGGMVLTAGSLQALGTYIVSGSGSTWTVYPSQTVGSSGSPVAMTADALIQGDFATSTNTGATYTLTPEGYADGYYQICFSDGECRATHLLDGNASVPAVLAGTNDPTVLGNYVNFASVLLTGATSGTLASNWTFPSGTYTVTFFPDGETHSVTLTEGTTSATWSTGLTGEAQVNAFAQMPLTGSSLTTAVTIAPMGDNYLSIYDGPVGTGFVFPGTSSFVFVTFHQFGPHTWRAPLCNPNSSGSSETPLVPDIASNNRIQIASYNMANVLANASTAGAASPDWWASFPGQASLQPSNGCLNPQNAGGYAYFDPATNLLYITFSQFVAAEESGREVIYVYQVNPVTSLATPNLQMLRPERAANDELMALAA